jgi:hypothetical protein
LTFARTILIFVCEVVLRERCQNVRQVSTALLSSSSSSCCSRISAPLTPRILGASQHWDSNMKSASEKTKIRRSNRKNSWVMLAESGGYTALPGEQTLYQSPPRTTLSLQTSHRHPPSESYSQQCKSGVVYLTNRRVRLQVAASDMMLTRDAAYIPSRRSHTHPAVLRSAHPQCRRLARHSTLVRRQQMGGHHTTRIGRRHSSTAR